MLRDHPLVVLANRDEFYERPTLAAHYWDDHPAIYAGRDMLSGGTWMGVTTGGRFAAVTNYRDPSATPGTRSRGELVADFLRSDDNCDRFLESLAQTVSDYSPFNLIIGTPASNELQYYSNRSDAAVVLAPGIYGLSNHLLDTPWPRVVRGKSRLLAMISGGVPTTGFEILADEKTADDQNLPSTGIPYEAEKALSAIFIKTPGYGTRSSTVIRFDDDGKWDFEEKVFV